MNVKKSAAAAGIPLVILVTRLEMDVARPARGHAGISSRASAATYQSERGESGRERRARAAESKVNGLMNCPFTICRDRSVMPGENGPVDALSRRRLGAAFI